MLLNAYQRYLLNPFLQLSVVKKPKPLFYTLLATVSGILILPAILYSSPYLAIIFLLLSGFFDTLDGAVARATNCATESGALLDICSDRLVEFTAVLAIYLMEPQTRGLPCLLVLGSILLCITSFLTVGIFTTNNSEKGFHYSRGLMERPEAFAFFIAMMLFPASFFPLAILFAILTTLTALIRIKQFLLRN